MEYVRLDNIIATDLKLIKFAFIFVDKSRILEVFRQSLLDFFFNPKQILDSVLLLIDDVINVFFGVGFKLHLMHKVFDRTILIEYWSINFNFCVVLLVTAVWEDHF